MPRFHCPVALTTGLSIVLPAGAARHVQVLRLQPGAALTLFNGEGGEFDAVVERMGRSEVSVTIGAHRTVEREPGREIHLAVGVPANERMDWLVEKATELGAAGIQPLITQRSVLRLSGERAEKKRAHWQSIMVAACEQCGRNRVPVVQALAAFDEWLAARTGGDAVVLSLATSSVTDHESLREASPSRAPLVVLSGPEGGLTEHEEEAACAAGFRRASLGPRVLRAETAALAALALLT